MVMRVLPRPISSARMPLRFFSCIDPSQSRATCWYSRSVPRMMCGTLTRTFAVASVAPVGISSFAVASVDVIFSPELLPPAPPPSLASAAAAPSPPGCALSASEPTAVDAAAAFTSLAAGTWRGPWRGHREVVERPWGG